MTAVLLIYAAGLALYCVLALIRTAVVAVVTHQRHRSAARHLPVYRRLRRLGDDHRRRADRW